MLPLTSDYIRAQFQSIDISLRYGLCDVKKADIESDVGSDTYSKQQVDLEPGLVEKFLDRLDPELLIERDLKDKLTALREITGENNRGLSEALSENKRTFESWVSGRYVPEGDKLKKVDKILKTVALMYVQAVIDDAEGIVQNIYTEFSEVFRLLDFDSAVGFLSRFFSEKDIDVDYETGKIKQPIKS